MCSVSKEKIDSSMERYRRNMNVKVKRVDFDKLDKWTINSCGDFVHESGKFFRICGGMAAEKVGNQARYQPIIDQPEQGILGIISRDNNGKTEILLQAKIEPGNLDTVQYSPTVQATKSNYTRVHKGKSVPYIDDFMEGSGKVLNRGYQSEHGYKFFKKANDNVHVHDNAAKAVDWRFIWLTLADIRYLLSKEHCVNMDTRSVLATIDFIGKSLTHSEVFRTIQDDGSIESGLLYSSLSEHGSYSFFADILDWAKSHKKNTNIKNKLIPLSDLEQRGWNIKENKINSDKNKNFELVGIQVSIESREVSSWFQPIVKDNIPKVYALFMKKINGIYHALVQMNEEDYSWSGAEIAPSVHSEDSRTFSLKRYIKKFGLLSQDITVIYDKFQSEEGGRFLEQRNQYMLAIIDDDCDFKIDNNFKWLTLYQLKRMTSYECMVNIECRTLLTIASYFKEEQK